MSGLGLFRSDLASNIVAGDGFDEVTGGVTTTAAALEDITGLTFDLTVPANLPTTGKIFAAMVVQASSSGGSPGNGGWAISIGGTDYQEVQRYLSGVSDTGVLIVMARVLGLSAGAYTVKGRHYRASGTMTVSTDTAQLWGAVIME